jgi:type IV pilus assembly protein PilV
VKRRQQLKKPRRTQQGFTLIEVLVALLILAIGLLGLAGMQASALRNNMSAYMRSQATFHVYEIIDRMRSNLSFALKENGKAGYDTGGYITSYGGTPCDTTCSEGSMAASDRKEWLEMVSRLPSGAGFISVDANGIATVRIRWSDRRDQVEAGDLFVLEAKTRL